ncbi:MAG: RdgB/HAM1 family non-canonical purine NTP pyrophosphatase [Treponema sp.]|jgi:XTP/dITP diphosphohydrolase|nr:RdgB/HAM1 family non-canonical purine NTP pyrophosphatase [Treponema sp.]
MNTWFASNNFHKKKELQAILIGNNVQTTLKIPVEEGYSFNPIETGTTFCENALLKARELKKILKDKEDIVIADDSGLCVDALNGKPGVFSANYGEVNGNKLTSTQQNLLLLDELGDNPVRSAYFVCTMVLLIEMDRFFIVQETFKGQIVKKSEMRGDGGFGYDPIFFLPELNRTLAELSAEEKNSISHRAKAGITIAKYIKDQLCQNSV